MLFEVILGSLETKFRFFVVVFEKFHLFFSKLCDMKRNIAESIQFKPIQIDIHFFVFKSLSVGEQNFVFCVKFRDMKQTKFLACIF